MRNLLLGIDSGTQSTKVVAVDAQTGNVLGTGAQGYDLIPNLPPGAKEQHPHTWRDATAKAIRQALRSAKATAAEVKAIGVSGQQHGFVPLDAKGEVIRPAPRPPPSARKSRPHWAGRRRPSRRSATPCCRASPRRRFSG